MKRYFRNIAKTALVLIYLVIVAGAVVRMTGSGMGCPDWPKCFGYYIPPTSAEELIFKPNHDYQKGVIIVKNESLLVAKSNFKSSEKINTTNWDTYTKHDYAIYNPTHTWVEYVNRLIGALSGIPILIFTFISFCFWRKNKLITIISILTVFGMAFQAWLGKTVVDSNLAPYKITIHMVMALVIVAFILYLIYASKKTFKLHKYDKSFKTLIVIAIALSLIQIVLGTQIRQDVDEQIKSIGYNKTLWLDQPDFKFYIHRTFSAIVLLINLALLYLNRTRFLGYNKLYFVLVLILAEVATGIAMYYFHFPYLSQPIHLVLASMLIGVQFYIFLECRSKKEKIA